MWCRLVPSCPDPASFVECLSLTKTQKPVRLWEVMKKTHNSWYHMIQHHFTLRLHEIEFERFLPWRVFLTVANTSGEGLHRLLSIIDDNKQRICLESWFGSTKKVHLHIRTNISAAVFWAFLCVTCYPNQISSGIHPIFQVSKKTETTSKTNVLCNGKCLPPWMVTLKIACFWFSGLINSPASHVMISNLGADPNLTSLGSLCWTFWNPLGLHVFV